MSVERSAELCYTGLIYTFRRHILGHIRAHHHQSDAGRDF